MGENAVRGTFGSYYHYPITHAQKIETLKEFFRADRTFKFRKQPGAPNVFTLFLDFAPHVEEDTKEAFLRNVWVAFQVFEKRKGHHAWHGSDPMRGEDPRGINATLFREGFLKYEVGLKTLEFNSGTAELNSRLDINALVNTSPNWWLNIEHFISEVLACGENNNAALLICQFCRQLKQASQNGDDLTAAETSLIEKLVIKRDVEAIHHTLANTTGRPIIWGIRICDVPLGEIKFGGTRQ